VHRAFRRKVTATTRALVALVLRDPAPPLEGDEPMKTSPFRRALFLVLTAVLALPVAACVCPDGTWGDDDHWKKRGAHDHDNDDGNWPPPTPPNEVPQPPTKRDAGTTNTVDARPADGGVSNSADGGAPRPVDAGVPNAVDGGATAPRDAGARTDGATCPTNACGPMPVCQFDNQCGPGGRCRNGACEHACDAATDCGTGQACTGGRCVTPSTPGGQCVYDRDCGTAASCINGTCHSRCTGDTGCPAGDRCVAGVCRADTGPRPQCRASSECPADQACVNAVCRTPCVSDVECCEGTSGSACRAGVCVTANEAAPECRLANQCGAAESCIDGMCAVD
jgi:hypothetical protein